MTHDFNILVNGKQVHFQSHFTHIEAGEKAATLAQHLNQKLAPEISEALSLFRQSRGMTYVQWGALHYLAADHGDVFLQAKSLGKQPQRKQPKASQSEIRKGVASQPVDPPTQAGVRIKGTGRDPRRTCQPPSGFRRCETCTSIISSERLKLVPKTTLCTACNNLLVAHDKSLDVQPRREDPGIGGTRQQWKANRGRYDG